jgi:hypothetical protein
MPTSAVDEPGGSGRAQATDQRQHRAAVDAASQARSQDSCRAALAAAVQQRLVTSADLLAVVRRFPTLPRRALILETIGDVGVGAHPHPELEWNDGIRRARQPARPGSARSGTRQETSTSTRTSTTGW